MENLKFEPITVQYVESSAIVPDELTENFSWGGEFYDSVGVCYGDAKHTLITLNHFYMVVEQVLSEWEDQQVAENYLKWLKMMLDTYGTDFYVDLEN